MPNLAYTFHVFQKDSGVGVWRCIRQSSSADMCGCKETCMSMVTCRYPVVILYNAVISVTVFKAV